jgi:hypothetical protein
VNDEDDNQIKNPSELHFDTFQLIVEPDLYSRLLDLFGPDACSTLVDSLQLQCQEYLPTLHRDYPIHKIGFGFFKHNLAADVVNLLNAKLEEFEADRPIDPKQIEKVIQLGKDFVVSLSNSIGMTPGTRVLGIYLSTIPPEVTEPTARATLRMYNIDSYHKIEPLM